MGGIGTLISVSPLGSVLLAGFLDLSFDQQGYPVREASAVGFGDFSGFAFQLSVDTEIDDLLFWH
jgi:hypothetical protein